MVTPSSSPVGCDKEDIHLIGGIQSHGYLLALSFDGIINQVSENIKLLTGLEPHELWEKKIDQLFTPACAKNILSGKEKKTLTLELLHPVLIDQIYSALVWTHDSQIIVEIEPFSDSRPLMSFMEFYEEFSHSIKSLEKAQTLEELCTLAVIEVKKITGFDRVWIHHLTAEDHFKVIAEVKLESQEPFLGMLFPGTDLPAQARRLFTLNSLRLISDIHSVPCQILPRGNLDLSLSSLRAVAPVHIDYLRNMNVAASMSVSLIEKNQLWGLISCHHNSPMLLPYPKRAACEFIGQMVSLQLPTLRARDEGHADLKHEKHLTSLIELFTKERISEIHSQAPAYEEDFLNLLSADTAVLILEGGRPIVFGESKENLQSLIDWLCQKPVDQVYHTSNLEADFSSTLAISGVVSISLSKTEKFLVAWFRKEQSQVITWGGNPFQDKEPRVGGFGYSPRKSFERWNELTQRKSLPWLESEIKVAHRLRSAMVNISVQQSEKLNQLNKQLELSNTELDAFAYTASHDLKEPLRGIHTYATFLIEDYSEQLDEVGKGRLKNLIDLSKKMDSLIDSLMINSRVGKLELNKEKVNLNHLLIDIADFLKLRLQSAGGKVQVMNELPTVECDEVRISEVFHNLIINALKYNENSLKLIEVGSFTDGLDSDETTYYLKDNGIGIDPKYSEKVFEIFTRLHPYEKYGGGAGAGLTIVKKIIERHGGRIWMKSTLGEGCCFFFTLGKT